MNSRKNHLELAEELKSGLIAHATDGAMADDRYVEIRRSLRSLRQIENMLPEFLAKCRNIDDFWSFIKSEFQTYQQRRDYLARELNPLLDFLESLTVTSSPGLTMGGALGRGGFGTVYRAKHEYLQLDFAFKIFEPAFDQGEPSHLDRFFREARILLALNHPHIARIFDAGLYEGRPFIRMELFEGSNLTEFLHKHGRFSAKKALVLVAKILQGLVHAHEEARVVHRDLKPSNVMVAKPERVKIVDFGLGVFIEDEKISRITKTGEKIWGGHYIAPELVENCKLIEPRSDLYSVAGIWYTALTNAVPVGLNFAERLREVEGISVEYETALLKGLMPLQSRYKSAREMLDSVAALQKELEGNSQP